MPPELRPCLRPDGCGDRYVRTCRTAARLRGRPFHPEQGQLPPGLPTGRGVAAGSAGPTVFPYAAGAFQNEWRVGTYWSSMKLEERLRRELRAGRRNPAGQDVVPCIGKTAIRLHVSISVTDAVSLLGTRRKPNTDRSVRAPMSRVFLSGLKDPGRKKGRMNAFPSQTGNRDAERCPVGMPFSRACASSRRPCVRAGVHPRVLSCSPCPAFGVFLPFAAVCVLRRPALSRGVRRGRGATEIRRSALPSRMSCCRLRSASVRAT